MCDAGTVDKYQFDPCAKCRSQSICLAHEARGPEIGHRRGAGGMTRCGCHKGCDNDERNRIAHGGLHGP